MQITMHGAVEPGYEPVADAFRANFTDRGEIGAAVCVYAGGRPVVDLWAGTADPETGRPWERDTLQLVYSAGKGVVATAAHLLAERGQLDLDAPVARYWPEFGCAGKRGLTVRWLLTHQAGLPNLAEPLPLADLLAWEPVTALLAGQAPAWEPGRAFGYHQRTYGWLVGEVVRRVTGASIGRYVADEIARPLGLDLHIGLPAAAEPRVSRLVYAPAPDLSRLSPADVPEQFQALLKVALDPDSLLNRPDCTEEIDYNAPAVHQAELPASNAIGTARSLARMYAALIGPVDGVRLLREDTVRAAIAQQTTGTDRVTGMPTRWGTGYQLPAPPYLPCGGPASFGHPGRGGSLAFADPGLGLAFGYVTNHIVVGAPDQRATDLVAALPAREAASSR
jgi:CubicO group peptidase (beta-lactamase class C family)